MFGDVGVRPPCCYRLRELRHRNKFGHFVSYGLHVDPMSVDFNIAIPGQTKMYWPEVSNFTFLPIRLPACAFPGDARHSLPTHAYAIQRLDKQSNIWQTVEATRFEFCLNPDNNESVLAYTYLLPGSSVEVASGVAVAAMEPFRKDDLARYVVFRQVVPGNNWDTAVSSKPFLIEDDVQRNEDASFRIRH